MGALNIQINEETDPIVVTVTDSLLVNESSVLREKILELIKQGNIHFLFDFSKLNIIDSSGLGVLVSIHKRVKERDGKLIIKGLHGEVKKIFELTRLTKVFDIVE